MLPKDEEHIIGSVKVHTAFDQFYSKLANREPVTCTQTGIEYAAISSPRVAILDVNFQYSFDYTCTSFDPSISHSPTIPSKSFANTAASRRRYFAGGQVLSRPYFVSLALQNSAGKLGFKRRPKL